MRQTPGMVQVVFGSTNPSKFDRMRTLLARVGVDLLDGSNIDVGEVVEGSAVRENAEIKARAYAAASSRPALATDYGLTVRGLRDDDQPNAYVRRVKADRRPVDDADLLEHYRRLIERLGGTTEGTWTGAIAVAFDTDEVVSADAMLTRTWVDRPSPVIRPGEPLASLQIDPGSGRYVSELSVESRAAHANPIDQEFLDFVAAQRPRLASIAV